MPKSVMRNYDRCLKTRTALHRIEDTSFRAIQRQHLKRLQEIKRMQKAGRNVDREIGKIRDMWISAGILDKDGNVSGVYKKVIK